MIVLLKMNGAKKSFGKSRLKAITGDNLFPICGPWSKEKQGLQISFFLYVVPSQGTDKEKGCKEKDGTHFFGGRAQEKRSTQQKGGFLETFGIMGASCSPVLHLNETLPIEIGLPFKQSVRQRSLCLVL